MKTLSTMSTREVLVECSMFNPEVFKMKDGVLMFTKAANRNPIGEVWWICLPGVYDKRSMESLSSE